jgi:VanZ family protein
MIPPRGVRLALAWLPLLLWLGLIFALSSRSTLPRVPLPSEAESWFRPYVSPLAHLGEYAVLGALAYRAARTGWTGRSVWIGVFIFGVAVGGLDETYQSTVPGRASELADVLADGAGTLLALAAIQGWLRWRGCS